MRVSVIIPYYNEEDVLDRCLRSLTDQDGDFEFLVINDMSTDGSEEIAKRYADQDDRFVPLQTSYKFGVSGARNTGLDNASGDWITFLDADDTMQPGAYKMFQEAVETCQGFNIIQFNHVRYYARKQRTAIKDPNAPGIYTSRRRPKRWREVWNKLYRAELAKRARFHLDLMMGEDELYNIECLSMEGRIRCAKGITVMHYYDGRPTLSKTKKVEDVTKLVRAMMDFIEEHDNQEARRLVCDSMAELWPRFFRKILLEE